MTVITDLKDNDKFDTWIFMQKVFQEHDKFCGVEK